MLEFDGHTATISIDSKYEPGDCSIVLTGCRLMITAELMESLAASANTAGRNSMLVSPIIMHGLLDEIRRLRK